MDGAVRLTVIDELKVGRHKLVARYLGAELVKSSKDKFTVVIRR